MSQQSIRWFPCLLVIGVLSHLSVSQAADPIITATKDPAHEAVRLSWSVGSKPFTVLVRRAADPAVDPDVVIQDGYTLYTFEDEGALVYTATPVLYYTVTGAAADDATPPTISITYPISGTSIPSSTPTITISYSDAESGLDLSTLRIVINDLEQSGVFTKTASGATFTPTTPLPDGINSIVATIEDTVGNQSSTTSSFSVAGPIITSLTPSTGLVGDAVTIAGDGFDASVPANNLVTFDGVPAAVTAATTSSLSTTVPTGALTGPVEVTVAGRTSNSLTFTVEIANGFSRINNIWFNSFGDMVVFDRWANTVYCVADGTTSKTVLDVSSTPKLRPVGLGVADVPNRLFYGRNISNPNYGPIHTIDAGQNCVTGGRQNFRNVQDSNGYPGFSYATAHRKGIYLGENAIYVAYREAPSGTYYYVFRVQDAGPRQQVPPGYTFPSPWTIVTGMIFNTGGDLFVSNGSLILYIPWGAASGSDVYSISSPELSQPAGMAFDDRGTLYVADQALGTIVLIRPSFTTPPVFDGTLETIATGLAAGTNGVRALEFRRMGGRPFLAVAESHRVFWLPLMEVEVREVEFDHKTPIATGSSVDIRHDSATDVQTPEWTILSTPRNEPVVYVQGQPIQIKARFRSAPGITSADIRATGSDTAFDLPPQTVTFANGLSPWTTYVAVGTVPSRAPEKFGLELQWKMSNINGGGSAEVDINKSGRHPIYIVYDVPVFPLDKGSNTREPWMHEVLDKAVTYAAGASDPTNALAQLARKLYDSDNFDYWGDATGANGGHGYGADYNYVNLSMLLAGHLIECIGNTKYFIILGRSMGIAAAKLGAKRCGTADPQRGCDPAWAFPTNPIRLTHRSAASCASDAWCFHMFPYDTLLTSVYDPLFTVKCASGSETVPANMPIVPYHDEIDPGNKYPLPCYEPGIDTATMTVK